MVIRAVAVNQHGASRRNNNTKFAMYELHHNQAGDYKAISVMDTGVILLVTAVAVGGVKLAYAGMVGKAKMLVGAGVVRGINKVASGLMVAVGSFVIAKVCSALVG